MENNIAKILCVAILAVPLLLNGFISFTDWIQFGIVIYLLYEFKIIESKEDIITILVLVFVLIMFFSSSPDPNSYYETEPHS